MIISHQTPQSLILAAEKLRMGELIGLPTETVYGLAADADNDEAVEKIYQAKGRPHDHPLIVHVASIDDGVSGVEFFASEIPSFAKAYMRAFWPGPLSLIFKRRMDRVNAAACYQKTIAIRCPAHPWAQELLTNLRNPNEGVAIWGVAAPSANRFGKVSPTMAEHVREELGDALLIVDAGACEVGIESTIVDCSREKPVLLRSGMISREDLNAIFPLAQESDLIELMDGEKVAQSTPKAPGTLTAHYAPSKQLKRLSAAQMLAVLDLKVEEGSLALYVHHLELIQWAKRHGCLLKVQPSDAHACAHELFSVLRELDQSDAQEIWVENPPTTIEWEGVNDRLVRACTGSGKE